MSHASVLQISHTLNSLLGASGSCGKNDHLRVSSRSLRGSSRYGQPGCLPGMEASQGLAKSRCLVKASDICCMRPVKLLQAEHQSLAEVAEVEFDLSSALPIVQIRQEWPGP